MEIRTPRFGRVLRQLFHTALPLRYPVIIFTRVQMAVDEKMVVLADEVYQANIWKKGASFSSFKKVRTCMRVSGFRSFVSGAVGALARKARTAERLCVSTCVLLLGRKYELFNVGVV